MAIKKYTIILVKRGHRVVLLTLCEPGLLHPIAENLGAEIESIDLRGKSKFYRYWFGVKRLYQAIKKYDIELVIAQQQMPALMSGVLHLFHKFKLVYVRHNTDEDYQNGYYKANALNRLVNKLVPNKIAPSRIVEKFWIEREGVRPQTIRRISYGYNFSQYQQADPSVVVQIREQHNCHLLILSIARMVPACIRLPGMMQYRLPSHYCYWLPYWTDEDKDQPRVSNREYCCENQ